MSELALLNRDYAPERDYSRVPDTMKARMRPYSGVNGKTLSGKEATLSSKKVKKILAFVLVFMASGCLCFLIVMPLTEIHSLTLTGTSGISHDELLAWSGFSTKSHWLTVDCTAIESKIAAHPRVASVVVQRRFPNTLVATVVDRSPIAVVYAKGVAGRMEAHCVDGQGVVFAPASLFVEASRLPVLSGLEIRGLWYGLKLEGPFPALLASLKELYDSNPALVSAISELRVVSRDHSPAELLVYPARYRVPVRMQPVLNAGLLKSMMLVLDVVEGEGLSSSIRELDLRTDTFIYRTKEAVSG